MKIHVIEGYAFMQVGTCTYLCLGTFNEYKDATPEQKAGLVISAFAYERYHVINTSPKRVH